MPLRQIFVKGIEVIFYKHLQEINRQCEKRRYKKIIKKHDKISPIQEERVV